MRTMWFILAIAMLVSGAAISGHDETSENGRISLETPDSAPADIDFNAQIRPILARRCFTCHGPDEETREASLRLDTEDGATQQRNGDSAAVLPGASAASPLIHRVTSTDPDLRMPPPDTGEPLSPEEISLLRQWIDEGADYAQHWAFVPPERPTVPTNLSDPDWIENPIDAFILRRLDEASLSPQPRADRATIIRRVTLDLTGLPPTPEEVDAFVNDPSDDAYEKVVDRLLGSPHFGEHWARLWLDLARYADSKGYEADRSRTMWPYRDWVIDALNRDLPYDAFTIEQLAGDLLPEPSQAQRIATAFHRNTMTNDEGGTDDEEFRVAAVVDRVNTTMQTWMGLTMACAQCHTHKYDPFTHEEYYQLFAFFNNTADSDKGDERPTLQVATPDQASHLESLRAQRRALELKIDATIETIAYEDPGTEPTPETDTEPSVFTWVDDDVPDGAYSDAAGGLDAFTWVTASETTPVFSGEQSLKRDANDGEITQWFFKHASIPLDIHDDTVLVAHVFLDPNDPPRQIMMQFHDGQNRWEHRAYWGENHVPWGADGTPSRLRLGDLPPTGEWVRLEVKAADVGLDATSTINGWAFTQQSGTTYWDAAGVESATTQDDAYVRSLAAWMNRVKDGRAGSVPDEIVNAIDLDDDARSAEHTQLITTHYLRHVHGASREQFAQLESEIASVEAEIARVQNAMPRLPVMTELAPEQQRTTHILERGSFLSPAAEVEPGTPVALHGWSDSLPTDRLGFARWLMRRDNPLVARVHVNRIWAQLFGLGIVETTEDFGTQGMLPSHPALLDWLAVEFMDAGWSMKHLCRTIVMSETYRQASTVDEDARQVDPRNRLLARAPRMRLPAEVIRDQALAVSGLLNPTLHGPPVFPPQPEGVWQIVYNADRWNTSMGEDRYRRGIYTYWRRTSPYPSMTTFDAPSREFCVSRRIRTNTPLQALVTMNDPVFVEAAQHLARRVMQDGGSNLKTRIDAMFQRTLARPATKREQATITELFLSERAHYRVRPDDALILATDPLGPLPDDMDPIGAAAWTVVANVIMNLDEFLTRD